MSAVVGRERIRQRTTVGSLVFRSGLVAVDGFVIWRLDGSTNQNGRSGPGPMETPWGSDISSRTEAELSSHFCCVCGSMTVWRLLDWTIPVTGGAACEAAVGTKPSSSILRRGFSF